MGNGATKKNPEEKLTKKDLRYFIKELNDHEGCINAMCLTPDETLLVTASEDKTARVLDLTTEDTVAILSGHEMYINHVVASNDFVFTASADRVIKKWRIDTGMCSKNFKGHTGPVNRLLLVQNILLSSSYDKTIRCWHINTGECLSVFSSHKSGVFPLLYIPENESISTNKDYADLEHNHDILVSGSADCTAKSWSMNNNGVLTTYKGHTGAVLAVATSKDGDVLFTSSQDNTIRSFDFTSGEHLKVFKGHQGSLFFLQVIMLVINLDWGLLYIPL